VIIRGAHRRISPQTTALLALSCLVGKAAAQVKLRGHVIDSEMGQPVAGAAVHIGNIATTFTADSSGQFLATDLPHGQVQITIQAIGYDKGIFKVYLPDSGAIEQDFALDFNGYMLPEIVVQARAENLMPRYVDFERRRQRKIGAYLRWDELKKYSTVGDALRQVRGVRIDCDQQRFECFPHMVRTPQCQPTWYIDGVEVQSFHENTPIRDVYGIEIYRGPGEIPAEFGGSNAACGVIVMWTKSRPYR
jgi:hypothetical protein